MNKPNNELRKILIIRLGAIGDVVHSTIMPQSIKEKHPDCEIHFLTADFIAPLIENDPNIAKVIPYDNKPKFKLLYFIKLGLALKKEKYDCIISLTNSLKNIIISTLAKPKFKQKRIKAGIHSVDTYFNTAKFLFKDIEKPKNLNLFIDEEIKNDISKQVTKYPRPYTVISPGGDNDKERQGRIWKNDYWIEFGNKITDKYGGTVFVCGSKGEQEAHKQYIAINNSVLCSGKLSLSESVALFSLADVFISGDSGPLHMASALGIKTIAIMGSTSPESCSPFGENGVYIEPTTECKYCGQKKCDKITDEEIYTPCTSSITPDMVLNLIEDKKLLTPIV